MQGSNNPRSTSSSSKNGVNGHYAEAAPVAKLEVIAQADGTPPGSPSDRARGFAKMREITKQRPRSLRMQYRFVRVVLYFWWLFVQVVWWQVVMARYMPERVERTNQKRWVGYARSFRAFAIDMGGLMIKLGQFVSTRGDVLPKEVTDELAALRDEVPSVPTYRIRQIIEAELGPLPERFSQFDDTPVAAASIGQVHRARLPNGDRVVVKVQRPGIVEICHTDLAAMNVVARVAMRFRFVSRRMDAVALIQEFGRVLLEELSYRHEAQNAARFGEMFRNNMGVYIPAVYTEHSTDCVITIEDVTSIKLDDFAALEAAGISRKAVAKRLIDTYMTQIFEQRFFHADPHPGNLFIYPLPEDSDAARLQDAGDGKPFYLIFIDFGMVGTLTPQIGNGLIGTMAAVVTRDVNKLVQSYSELGFLLPGADTDRLTEATHAVFDQVWGLPMEEITNISYGDVANIGKEFNDLLFAMPFQVPQDFIYLGRTVGILSGLSTSLDPSFNPWNEIQPYAQKLIVQGVSANGDSPVTTLLGSSFLQSLFGGNGGQALLNIGQTILGRTLAPPNNDVLGKIERGELKLRVEAATSLQNQLAKIEGQSRRTTRAVIFGSVLVTSTLFYTNGDLIPAAIGYVVSGVTFLSMLLSGE